MVELRWSWFQTDFSMRSRSIRRGGVLPAHRIPTWSGCSWANRVSYGDLYTFPDSSSFHPSFPDYPSKSFFSLCISIPNLLQSHSNSRFSNVHDRQLPITSMWIWLRESTNKIKMIDCILSLVAIRENLNFSLLAWSVTKVEDTINKTSF